MSEEQIAKIKKLRLEGKSLRKIAEQVGCSLGTVQRTLK
ncbi:helix-turn-helix domain-containing protein [Intestinibacter sp.]